MRTTWLTPFGVQFCALGIGQRKAGAVIFGRLLRGNLVPPHVGQLFGRAIAFERMAIRKQPVAMLGINRASFRLAIGAVRAADIGAFVPAEAKPFQRLQDHFFGLRCRARLIGILDPQQELASMLFGKAIIDKRNIGGADMRVAGWRGRNTGTNCHGTQKPLV